MYSQNKHTEMLKSNKFCNLSSCFSKLFALDNCIYHSTKFSDIHARSEPSTQQEAEHDVTENTQHIIVK